jgi:hypothetical protein
VTSLQALAIWLWGGGGRRARPVGHLPLAVHAVVLVVGALVTLATWRALVSLRGAAP